MKNKKIYLLLTCILLVCLTGCRDYTAHGRSNDENNTVNEQAIKEENDAVKFRLQVLYYQK